MPRSSVASTASGMLNDLKSRLGFSQNAGEGHAGGADDFGEYDDFDEGYSERYDSEFAGYGADYDENAPVGGYRGASAKSGRFGTPDSYPNLVSISDVKANSPLAQPSTAGRASGRNLINNRAPAQSSPAYNAALRDRERDASMRPAGVDSLFEPSTASSFEPYSAASTSSFSRARNVSVVRPVSYSDVERVARSLKAGDVVVLAMRATPGDLMQRILDFSFGAASALDANVECPAERVFAIARGQALTESELKDLRGQGVL